MVLKNYPDKNYKYKGRQCNELVLILPPFVSFTHLAPQNIQRIGCLHLNPSVDETITMVDVSRLHDRPFPTIRFLLSKSDVQVGTRTSEAQFRILVMQTYMIQTRRSIKKHTDAKKLTFIITASYLSIP